MREVYKTSALVWKPSPIVALATSVGELHARQDGSLEVWVVSLGSIHWHCQLTVHGDSKSLVSSLVWCHRLLSSSIDGAVSEWDLFNLNQKVVLESMGVSIWQMAVSPKILPSNGYINGHVNGHAVSIRDCISTDSEDEDDVSGHQEEIIDEAPVVALACDSDRLVYIKSLPRVSGRTLSVTWGFVGRLIYSGSSDGFIRCWDAKSSHETYRINVGRGNAAIHNVRALHRTMPPASGGSRASSQGGPKKNFHG